MKSGRVFWGTLFVIIGVLGIAHDEPGLVLLTSPVDGATDVPVDSAVTATFDEDLDPATVTTSTFELLAAGSPVASAVTCVFPFGSALMRTVPSTPESLSAAMS